MGYVTTKDGVEIFYKDWGPKDAPVIHFHHGWPLSADDWDSQMLFSSPMGSESLPTIAGVMAAPAKCGMVTIWTITPTMWRRWSITSALRGHTCRSLDRRR